jgi:hypothetical protein
MKSVTKFPILNYLFIKLKRRTARHVKLITQNLPINLDSKPHVRANGVLALHKA